MAAEIRQRVAITSFHLRALATAGLVTTRRDGTRIDYRLASNRVGELWTALRDVTAAHHERLDELAAGDAVVIDVRPEPEYAAGHIAGVRSNPIDDLAAYIKDLPADVETVAYFRGPYCVFADDSVRLMRRRGRAARRLEVGFPNDNAPNCPPTSPPRHHRAPHSLGPWPCLVQ